MFFIIVIICVNCVPIVTLYYDDDYVVIPYFSLEETILQAIKNTLPIFIHFNIIIP